MSLQSHENTAYKNIMHKNAKIENIDLLDIE